MLKAADEVAHFVAQVGIEVGERFVEEEDLGLEDEGAGKRNALLLPAREFGGAAVLVAGKLNEVEDFGGALGDVVGRVAAHLQAEADVLADGEVGKE